MSRSVETFAAETAAVGEHHLLLTGHPAAQQAVALQVARARKTNIVFSDADDTAGRLLGTSAEAGRVSAADQGVLYLDQAYTRDAGQLDALRQPLDTGSISLHHSSGVLNRPAQFQLVLDGGPQVSPARRLSGPLLDRMDMRLHTTGRIDEIDPVRVDQAREAMFHRLSTLGEQSRQGRRNRDLSIETLAGKLAPGREAMQDLNRALDRAELSLRGYARTLRTAWSVADLHGHHSPTREDVATAYDLRRGETEMLTGEGTRKPTLSAEQERHLFKGQRSAPRAVKSAAEQLPAGYSLPSSTTSAGPELDR
ncbi:ATP-binding protein [Nesterenkonia alkaliphila]|uniref:ATP-binding protein n=1 Tax=Nesterenkonia alkaliphila TaxID=1463631 RepID=A0A7K1UH51_9MICC|nr:ATP-binding protein [Nesterenkonia alkaliphila]MVT25734.1 hypothetical protein [Nesterenkonia alkaliphila]GFZ85432.1 hypothetical protein GCM10011359_13210 [Nesterenkonia alkaliphila]